MAVLIKLLKLPLLLLLKLLNYFKDGTNVRKVVIAVASVLGIAGLATAVLGSLVKLNLIPRDWFPPQFRF